MLTKDYFAVQYLLKRAFRNASNTISVTSQHTSQDYLNAVFSEAEDAIRVSLAGSMLPAVGAESQLPATADMNQLCPVVSDSGSIAFYQYNGTTWRRVGSTSDGAVLSPDQMTAVSWLAENLDRVKECTDYDYAVKVERIPLNPNSLSVLVQGVVQNIDDDSDTDSDATTPYRIDVRGYVLGVEAYMEAADPIPTRYYTKVVYEASGSGAGTSHIYLEQEEFSHFASLGEGKNELVVQYLENVFPSNLRVVEMQYAFPGEETHVAVDGDGSYRDIRDDEDLDNDPTTVYRLTVPGFVLDVQAYFQQEDTVKTRCLVKLSYSPQTASTDIYLDYDSHAAIAALVIGKNIVSVYTLGALTSEDKTVLPIDSVLDGDSMHAIQNRTVYEAIQGLREEIAQLRARLG